jgi:DNA-binding NarL/FixJ family response regulator
MAKVNILLADDHAIVRAGIRKTIEEMPGINCVGEVGNGPQVLAALEKFDIDCLLIDVTMPDFEPIAMIRQIRKMYPDLKILVVSAYDDDVYVQGLLGAGVNGYHMKDQPLNDLKLAVNRVLAGQRWITSSLIDKLVEKPEKNASIPKLTNRQRTLLLCLQQGLDNQTIAQETGLSVKTIENHMTRLYRQLGVQSRLEAANYAMRHPQILGAPAQNIKRIKIHETSSSQHDLSILVVDDNARYRNQLQRMIGKLYPKAMIYEAENIVNAMNIAKQIDLKLALVDVVLGDVNGINCVRQIKTIRPDTRVILISAYPDREFHRQGLESGAVAFLDKKDLDLATLRQVIDDVPE